MTTQADISYEERRMGKARQGEVWLRHYDLGVIETLGAKLIGDRYFLPELNDFDPPPGLPGFPVVFSHPEEILQSHKVPVVMVRRDDFSYQMNRWHPGTVTYRVPAIGTLPVVSPFPTDPYVPARGAAKYEQHKQSMPFDLLYTVSILAKSRESMAAAQSILHYVMKIYQVYCRLLVRDSLGDIRSYEAFSDQVSPVDQASEIANRMIGFTLSLRIEGELDINDPEVYNAVTKPAQIRMIPTRLVIPAK